MAAALAVMFVTVLTVRLALAAGAVIETVGTAAAITLTETAAVVVATLSESVALAVRLAVPVVVGVR